MHGTSSPEFALPLAMLVIFGSAKILAEVCERLSMPAIVGEILAGVLVGPSVLGWIEPNEFLSALANLGAMFLLFRVGMEVKSSELIRVGGTATVVALLGVVVPFAAGWLLMAAWGLPQIEQIFTGAAMVATSVGITAQVLASKGLLAERSSKIILAAAVIDDVLGLLILAVVSGMAQGSVNYVQIGITAALAIGFTILVALLGTRSMTKVVPRLGERLRLSESQFSFSLILLFALALLAVYAGVAAIVGAFLAGMALSESVEERVKELTHGVTELLLPFFLAGIGLHVDLHTFANLPVLALSIVISIAAVLSKLVGCGLGALSLGKVDAIRVGVGMVPRGEVGMVVAQLGLALHVVRPDTYAVVVFMAVATTLVAPPMLKLAFRGAGTGEQEVAEIS
ncbi:MAG: cation:proton antiporter [Bryobacteraceae bacterium]